MRSVLWFVSCLIAAAPAVAQPVTRARTCDVTIARAPDEVRIVIEAWVASEPRCATSLELRIVPTDSGLYMLARDGSGRVRERVVPDAQSAGVLVASWIADDAAPAPNEIPHAPGAAPAPHAIPHALVAGPPEPAARAPVLADTAAGPPEPSPALAAGAAPGLSPVLLVGRSAAPPSCASRWLTFGGMVGMQDAGGTGMRAELDLKTWRRWSLGIAASWSESGRMLHDGGSTASLWATDSKGLVYVARTSYHGRWQFRALAGAGAVYTDAEVDWYDAAGHHQEADGAFPFAEVSLAAARELGARWAVYAGPIATVFAQRFVLEMESPGRLSHQTIGREVELKMFVGLRHRL